MRRAGGSVPEASEPPEGAQLEHALANETKAADLWGAEVVDLVGPAEGPLAEDEDSDDDWPGRITPPLEVSESESDSGSDSSSSEEALADEATAGLIRNPVNGRLPASRESAVVWLHSKTGTFHKGREGFPDHLACGRRVAACIVHEPGGGAVWPKCKICWGTL